MIKVQTREEFLKACLLHLPENPVCCEVGVYKGFFSRMIFDHLKPKYLLMVDPFETKDEPKYGGDMGNAPVLYSDGLYDEVVANFSTEVLDGRAIIFRKPSIEATKEIPDWFIDFIYIDGSHLYADVKEDLKCFLPKLRANPFGHETGLLCGHDYTDQPSFGVKRAVDEFCEENNFKFVILNENGGDFALMRK